MPCHTIAPFDSARNARSVREDTAELASYVLADGGGQRKPSFLRAARPSLDNIGRRIADHSEETAPGTSRQNEPQDPEDGPSALANLLRKSPPDPELDTSTEQPEHSHPAVDSEAEEEENYHQAASSYSSLPPQSRNPSMGFSEQSPLLGRVTSSGSRGHEVDLEGQKGRGTKSWYGSIVERGREFEHKAGHVVSVAVNPTRWDRKALWDNVVVAPASCLPAVCVGLLLNILDALSYGMIFHILPFLYIYKR